MITIYAFMIGGLFAISIYLLLSHHLMRWLFGIVILSSSVNLFILVVGRLSRFPPFISSNNNPPFTHLANPLPQALILTALVISFGLLTFALVLVRKIWELFGTVDSDQLHHSEIEKEKDKT